MEVNLIIDEDIKFKNRTDDEIYSITLELINNTIKHANSTKICINLKKEERVIRYIYSDNGNGFSKTKKNGMGLEEIRKKVNSMYGTIEISNLSSGFELIINLPDFVEGFLVG